MRRRKITLLATVAATIVMSACSNQQAYNAVRDNRIDDCQYRLPSEREECLRRYEKTYEEYERERQEALDETE